MKVYTAVNEPHGGPAIYCDGKLHTYFGAPFERVQEIAKQWNRCERRDQKRRDEKARAER